MNNIDKMIDNFQQTFEEMNTLIENRITEIDKQIRFNKRLIFANNVVMALLAISFLLYAGLNIDAADWKRCAYFLGGSFLVLILAIPDP